MTKGPRLACYSRLALPRRDRPVLQQCRAYRRALSSWATSTTGSCLPCALVCAELMCRCGSQDAYHHPGWPSPRGPVHGLRPAHEHRAGRRGGVPSPATQEGGARSGPRNTAPAGPGAYPRRGSDQHDRGGPATDGRPPRQARRSSGAALRAVAGPHRRLLSRNSAACAHTARDCARCVAATTRPGALGEAQRGALLLLGLGMRDALRWFCFDAPPCTVLRRRGRVAARPLAAACLRPLQARCLQGSLALCAVSAGLELQLCARRCAKPACSCFAPMPKAALALGCGVAQRLLARLCCGSGHPSSPAV